MADLHALSERFTSTSSAFPVNLDCQLAVVDPSRHCGSTATIAFAGRRSSAFQPGCRPRQDIFPRPREICAAEAVRSLVASSRDCSRQLAGLGKKDGVVKGVDQNWPRRLGQRKDARHTLETPGSANNLKGHCTEGLSCPEIDAIASSCENDVQ